MPSTNAICYEGQQWEIALRLFRELQATGANPSVVTYNTTMTALEKGLQVSNDLSATCSFNGLNTVMYLTVKFRTQPIPVEKGS